MRDKSLDFATCHIQSPNSLAIQIFAAQNELTAHPRGRQGFSKPITISLFTLMVPAAQLSQIKSQPTLHFPY